MMSDFGKNTGGDSARNRLENRLDNSKHVFDGAGENVQLYLDHEDEKQPHTKRYINPAICIERVLSSRSATSLSTESESCTDVTPHPHSTYRSTSTPYLSGRDTSVSSTSVKRISCSLDCEAHSTKDDSPRVNYTYRENGSDTFRLSVASISTSSTTKEDRQRIEERRRNAYRQWLAQKEQERREKERLEKLQLQPVRVVTEEERERCYQKWLEMKRTEAQNKKAEMIVQHCHSAQDFKQDRKKLEREKQEAMTMWKKRKAEELKAIKMREEKISSRLAMEAEKRRADGERAYQNWLRTSKHKPLPVPLNRGELSMRGSVSEMYINPEPWKSLD